MRAATLRTRTQVLLTITATLIAVGSGVSDTHALRISIGRQWIQPGVVHAQQLNSTAIGDKSYITDMSIAPQFFAFAIVVTLACASYALAMVQILGRVPRRLVVSENVSGGVVEQYVYAAVHIRVRTNHMSIDSVLHASLLRQLSMAGY